MAGNFRTVVWLLIAVVGVIIGFILSLYSLKNVVIRDVTGLQYHASLPTGRSYQRCIVGLK